MRFGGHETFAIRQGWLPKGLTLLHERSDQFFSPELADRLGVGQNMGKSIRHWLAVTGLVAASDGEEGGRLAITPLGRLVLDRDPCFLESGTWWALHYHTVTHRQTALAWSWFFNHFTAERFDRPFCTDRFRRHLETEALRMPSANTLTKDLLCLLASYGQPMPAEPGDPEDSIDCPFRELGLLVHFRDSGSYLLRRDPKDIPAALVGYMLAATFGTEAGEQPYLNVSLRDVLSRFGSLGRVLALSPDALMDTLQRAEFTLGDNAIAVIGMAGERYVRVRARPVLAWLVDYYEEIDR